MGLLLSRYLTLELTRACNYTCPYCAASAGKPLRNELTKEEIFGLLARVKPDYLAITGGEPLLRKDLFEIIDFGNRFGRVRLNTNGSLITPAAAEKLNAHEILISVDGLPEKNAALRGENNFDHILKALDNLEAAGKLNRVRLCITASKENLDEIVEIINYFSPRVRRFGIGKLAPMGRAGKDKMLSRREAAGLYFRLLPLRLKNSIYFYYEFGGFLRVVPRDLTILADGSIVPCCLVRKPVGNVRTTKRLPWLSRFCLLFLSGCADCKRLRPG